MLIVSLPNILISPCPRHISYVAPAILTVAPAISNRCTGIYDRGAEFAELSATFDITSAFQVPDAIVGAFRPRTILESSAEL